MTWKREEMLALIENSILTLLLEEEIDSWSTMSFTANQKIRVVSTPEVSDRKSISFNIIRMKIKNLIFHFLETCSKNKMIEIHK